MHGPGGLAWGVALRADGMDAFSGSHNTFYTKTSISIA